MRTQLTGFGLIRKLISMFGKTLGIIALLLLGILASYMLASVGQDALETGDLSDIGNLLGSICIIAFVLVMAWAVTIPEDPEANPA